MYNFLVWFATAIVIIGFLYFLFRRPRKDAQYDKNAQTMDKIAQTRDQNVSDQQKYNRF
jgi:preprotein translocase subunit YajC